MAVTVTTEIISITKSKAFAPANTGGGNPRTPIEATVRPPKTRPPVVIRQRCIPRPYVYPKYLALPVGENNKGRFHLLRYSCLRTTIRWMKIYQAIKQTPISHTFPLNLFPTLQSDRNISPVSGKDAEHGKARNVRAQHTADL